MFWLSHHGPDELDRCYHVGAFHVCARCLGTYPVLLLAIVLQARLRAPLSWSWDLAFCVAMVLPATLDWAYGRFFPHRFSNLWRSFTGALLGIGLGRSLFIHFQQPWPAPLLAQALVVTGVTFPVILLAYLRNRRR